MTCVKVKLRGSKNSVHQLFVIYTQQLQSYLLAA